MHTTRSPRPLLLLLSGVVALGVLLAPTTGPAAAQEVHWSVAPADDDGPDGRVSLRHVVEPGESVTDHVAVTNLGGQQASFSVLAGDGVLGENGAYDIAPRQAEAAGSWLDIGGLRDGELTVDAGSTRVVPVTITVPQNATPGDAPAGIVVARSGEDGDVTVTHRIGVRLHLQVAGELQPQLEVSDVQTSFSPSLVPFAPGTLTATYRVANTGNVRLGAGVEVSASLPFGLLERSEVTTQDELLPGDEITMTTEVSAWPTGLLLGDVALQGIVVGEDVVDPSPVVNEGFVRPAISWTGLLVLLLVGGFVWWRRRSSGDETVTGEGDAPQIEAETVNA